MHDDNEALLEGYAEPRLAASHSPDWTISLQNVLHISYALVPSDQEYEFVITLATETARFNAPSWDIMQEWVDTLRQKLREMKILSPKENLYSKMPELRPPLLPTRDPMSPLPAPPPIPAAMVPGVERVIPNNSSARTATASNSNLIASTSTSSASISPPQSASEGNNEPPNNGNNSSASSSAESSNATTLPTTSMSNTLTQNLINMLSNPVSAYSNQLNGITSESETSSLALDDDDSIDISQLAKELSETDVSGHRRKSDARDDDQSDSQPSLAQTFTNNVLSDPHTCAASTSGLSSYVDHIRQQERSSERNDAAESSTDSIPTPEPPIVIPRPQTVRSSSNKEVKSRRVNQTSITSNEQPSTSTSDGSAAATNITIIQVSSPLHHRKERKDLPEVSIEGDDNYKSNVQIIPSNFNPPNTNKETETSETEVTTVQVSTGTAATATTAALSSAYGKIMKKHPAIKAISLNASDAEPTNGEATSNAVRSFGPVTNVPINADKPIAVSTTQLHYEQVFVTPPASASPRIGDGPNESASPKFIFGNKAKKSASQSEVHINRINLSKNDNDVTVGLSNPNPITVSVASTSAGQSSRPITTQTSTAKQFNRTNTNGDLMAPSNRPLLTRGVTEAVIQRPSRKDSNVVIPRGRSKPTVVSDATNNSIRNEVFQPRQRSSSTSDAQGLRNRANNNNGGPNNNNNNNNNQLGSTAIQNGKILTNRRFRSPRSIIYSFFLSKQNQDEIYARWPTSIHLLIH